MFGHMTYVHGTCTQVRTKTCYFPNSEHNYDDNEATSEANYEAIFEETSSKAAATQVGLPVVAMFAITFATILL